MKNFTVSGFLRIRPESVRKIAWIGFAGFALLLAIAAVNPEVEHREEVLLVALVGAQASLFALLYDIFFAKKRRDAIKKSRKDE